MSKRNWDPVSCILREEEQGVWTPKGSRLEAWSSKTKKSEAEGQVSWVLGRKGLGRELEFWVQREEVVRRVVQDYPSPLPIDSL